MEPLTAAVGLLTVGAITPGPNNLLVLRESAHRGWKGALPAGIGIVSGGLALLLAVVAGASALLRVQPVLTRAMGFGACLLLIALGAAAIAGSVRPGTPAPAATPVASLGSLGGLFFFQFLNPKAWILVVAVVSSIGPGSDLAGVLPQLMALFVLIPAACLTLWSLAGLAMTRHLERRPVRAWFDRVTGGLLIGFAFLLLIGGLDVR